MTRQWHFTARAAFVATATALLFTLGPLVEARSDDFHFFTGGGFGPTPEYATQAAIWDAEASAGSEGLYSCTMVDQPSVFRRADGPKGPRFTAEATLACK